MRAPNTITHMQLIGVGVVGIAAALAVATAAPAQAASWIMPNLIGANLQVAQNAIQELTDYAVFYSSSTDLTGLSRMQIDDSNWQVCRSTPLPGASFSEDTPIDFGVVKLDETCP